MNISSSKLFSPAVKLVNVVDKVFQKDYRARLINWQTGFHSPSYRFSKNSIAFVHIPKTGGTTISEVLEQGCKTHPTRFTNLHMHRPVSKFCQPSEYQYITMLRNPVTRVYSYFKMAERNDSDNPYGHLCKRGLEHFLSHCWETQNLCCQYLAGKTKAQVNEDIYKRACDNLLQFKFIGLFEQFETSINQLMNMAGLHNISIPHRRPSQQARPSEKEHSIIEQFNTYDIRLYEFYLKRKPDIMNVKQNNAIQ